MIDRHSTDLDVARAAIDLAPFLGLVVIPEMLIMIFLPEPFKSQAFHSRISLALWPSDAQFAFATCGVVIAFSGRQQTDRAAVIPILVGVLATWFVTAAVYFSPLDFRSSFYVFFGLTVSIFFAASRFWERSEPSDSPNGWALFTHMTDRSISIGNRIFRSILSFVYLMGMAAVSVAALAKLWEVRARLTDPAFWGLALPILPYIACAVLGLAGSALFTRPRRKTA